MTHGAEDARVVLCVVTGGSLGHALPPRDGRRPRHVTSANAFRRMLFGERTTRADRALRLCSIAVAAWLAATLSLVARASYQARDPIPVAVHVLALAAVCLLLMRDDRTPRLLRDWLPLAFLPFLYVDARWPIAGLGRPHADAVVHGWELAAFPSDPSRSLAVTFHNAALSELLHLAYLSYYGLVYLSPLLVYVRRPRPAFAETMLALTAAFGICFVASLVFPVDGPRFIVGAAAAPEGPARSLTLALLQGASTRGMAFPSMHVAGSVAAAICAVRFARPLGYVFALFTAALMAGTVYGGFHYAVDVVAGLVVGVLSVILAALAWRANWLDA